MTKSDIEKENEHIIASEIGEDVAKMLRQFYVLDVDKRDVLATKMFPIYMKAYKKGKQEMLQTVKDKRKEYYKREDLDLDEVDTILLNELLQSLEEKNATE